MVDTATLRKWRLLAGDARRATRQVAAGHSIRYQLAWIDRAHVEAMAAALEHAADELEQVLAVPKP